MTNNSDTAFFGHPKPLLMLFFAEMWERFSFYGMRALLILYLTKSLFEDLQDPLKKATAYGIYAAYGALVYTTPFIGGLIADRYLGYKKSVILGAVLMAIGHLVMAVENEFWLYVALSFLIIGNGFFKPNISSIVGRLYKDGDKRKDAGFTIFYMGINLGAFLAPLACGFLGETFDWFWGFSLAGVGMIIGLWVFWRNIDQLEGKGDVPNKERLFGTVFLGLNREKIIYILSFVSVILFALLVKNYELMGYILVPFSIAVFLIIIIIAFMNDKQTRDRLFVILYLLLFTMLFWAFFEQAGSSITLYTSENVLRSVFGFELKASIFQAANPLFIMIFAIPLSFMWLFLGKRKAEPNIPIKFALGLFLLGVGFLFFYWGNQFISTNSINIGDANNPHIIVAATVPLFILLFAYLFHTLGELCLSPIGLSMVTKLAPKKLGAMIMGAWFLSSAMAHHLGGIIATFTAETDGKNPVTEVVVNTTTILEESGVLVNIKTVEDKQFKDKLTLVVDKGIKELMRTSHSINLDTAEVLDFKLESATDSVLAYVKKENLYEYFENGDFLEIKLKNTFTNSLAVGAQILIENGNLAINKALDGEYITKEESEQYSVSTAASLGGLLNYNKIFGSLGLIAIASSILLLLTSPFVKKAMHGVE